jgi:hypothetical protein
MRMWTYRYLAAAVAERAALVPREKAALINAEAKLEFVVAAIGPEPPAGFVAACRRAEARLAEMENAI